MFEKSELYDIYGGLLPKNQMLVYEYHINDDLSFAEIGEELDITRQASYDLFKNADEKLKSIDKKLQLVSRFKSIEKLANDIIDNSDDENIKTLAQSIIKQAIKGGKN